MKGVTAEEAYHPPGHGDSLPKERWLFDQEALQEYLLVCCQDPRGGLVDKPGKARDFYHTCYTLSGLSVAQNFAWRKGEPNCRVMGVEELNKMVWETLDFLIFFKFSTNAFGFLLV